MKKMLVAAVLVVTSPSGAQQITLPGVISIQNSEYETGKKAYVSAASIRAPFAKAVSSDRNGQFVLAFAGVENGMPVRLTVSKPGLEVVNTKETDQVILGRVPQLQVVMADPEKLAEAQAKYYRIAIESIARNYDRRMAALRSDKQALEQRLADLSAQAGKPLGTMEEAIEALTKMRSGGLEHAQDLALQFAQVNLDDASMLYRQAFQLFQRGQMDSVLLVLDKDALQHEYEKLNKESASLAEAMSRTKEGLQQLFRSYELKEQVLEASFDHAGAQVVLAEMRKIVDAHPEVFDPSVKVDVMCKTGMLSWKTGNYVRALEEQRAAFTFGSAELPPEHPVLLGVLSQLGVALFENGQLDSALSVFTRSLTGYEHAIGAASEEAALAHNNISLMLAYKGDFAGTIEHAKQSIRIREQDSTRYAAGLAESHTNVSYALLMMGNLEGALAEERRAIAMATRGMDPGDPRLARMHHELGAILLDSGDLTAAMDEMQQCVDIELRTLGPDHPDLAVAYDGMAAILTRMDDIDSAISYTEKSLGIFLRTFGEHGKGAAMQHNNLGVELRRKGDLTAAMIHLRKGVELAERDMAPDDPDQIMIHVALGSGYLGTCVTDSALITDQKALDLALKLLGPVQVTTGRVYQNLGVDQYSLGNYEEAIPLFRKSASIIAATHGPGTIAMGATLTFMRMAFLFNGDLDSAANCIEQGMNIYRSLHPVDSVNLADADLHLAWVNGMRGDLGASLLDAERALRTVTRLKGPVDQRIANGSTAVGWLRERNGDQEGALSAYRSALVIYQKLLCPTHWVVGRTHYYLARTLYNRGDRSAAKAELDSAMSAAVTKDAAWYQYLIARDAHDDPRALDRLCTFMRKDRWSFIEEPVDEAVVREQLRDLAKRQKRKDILKEFQLD